jgi:hypothetical protein
VVTTEPKSGEESRAILIGVSAYEDAEFPPIRAARNSLTEMNRVLTDSELCGWRPEEITVISNPHFASDLAVQVTNLARATTGVLMIYYVGHGSLSGRGELCLTVTTTQSNHPKLTGLPWNLVADALRESPARMRFAILDCCFAGQAIEALAGDSSEALADITHVEGVYTLTATTRNRTAHVPPPNQQDTANTSFTGELVELIKYGIPQGPADLTLGVIYAHLRTRLAARGLPLPNQRNTDLADKFVFSKNISAQIETDADAVDDQSEQDAPSSGPNPSPEAIRQRELAAQAFYEIATDAGVDTEDRLEAAFKLAEISKQHAADALSEIASEFGLDTEDRLRAAYRLAELNEEQGAEALFEIGADDSIDTQDRREAAERLTGLNEELAAEALNNIALDEGRNDTTLLVPSRPIITMIAVIAILPLIAILVLQLVH